MYSTTFDLRTGRRQKVSFMNLPFYPEGKNTLYPVDKILDLFCGRPLRSVKEEVSCYYLPPTHTYLLV
jgi:hypothetical protein